MNREIRPELLQCMLDAGFSEAETETVRTGDCCAVFSMLEAHRRRLLCEVHDRERNIGIIDYIIYQLKKDLCAKESKNGD